MGPTVANGVKYWYNEEGKLHREDGPAVEYPNGGVEWYRNGRKHRLGGPAVDNENYTEYYVDGNLHRDGGPSTVYHKGDEDGTGKGQKLYHLNGVLVPQYIAEATDEEFDRSWFMKETNVEVRREIIRKFGMERIFKITDNETLEVGEAHLLDKDGDYELLHIQLTPEVRGKYLKMKNPSIGTWHLEAVAPECDSVKEALVWRNGGLKGDPEILT